MECLKFVTDAMWEGDPDITGDQMEGANKALAKVCELFKLPPRGALVKLHGDVDSKVTVSDKEITLTIKVENDDQNLVAANHVRNLAFCLVAVEEPQPEQLELREDEDAGSGEDDAHPNQTDIEDGGNIDGIGVEVKTSDGESVRTTVGGIRKATKKLAGRRKRR